MPEQEVSPEIQMEAIKEELTTEVGSLLHDEWRASRKKENGTFEPRVKKTKDQAWTEKNGTDQVDIANTDYRDLPEDWKGENKASAEVAIGEIYKAGGKNLDENFIEKASAAVHDAWRERNKSWAPKEQMVEFDELSEEEKNKDRVMVEKAVEMFKKKMGQ